MMEKQKRRAAVHNLGCKVNAYETEAMQQLLEEAGYEIVAFEEKADVYLINTCSVTNMADRKSRQMLHRARKQNPDAVIVAAGCYVQEEQEAVLSSGDADLIIGNNQKSRLVQLLETYWNEKERRAAGADQEEHAGQSAGNENRLTEAAVLDMSHVKEYEELSLNRTAEHTRAFIKIQDGCNQFCSYCIIPYMRGRIRSRALPDILAEVERLAAAGYKEVVLTGIHLSSYGKDLEEPASLLEVIRQTAQVGGIERIRLGSLEPGIITEDFVKELASVRQVCPHFHLSLQSGCDATLRRMNRHYTTAEYEEKCRLIRRYFEHPAITTDVIVGFPGETEQEFLETLSFLKKIQLYEIHVFKYSARKGTKAAGMPDQVPEQEKSSRSHVVLQTAGRMTDAFHYYYRDKIVEVLFEEARQFGLDTYVTGFTREYVKVAVKETEENRDMLTPGTVRTVKITGVLDDRLLSASLAPNG